MAETEIETGIRNDKLKNVDGKLKNADVILDMVQAATFKQQCDHDMLQRCDKDCASRYVLELTTEQHRNLLDFLEKARDAKDEVEDLV